MTEAQYDSLRARGHGLCYCPICGAPTWFTHDDHGEQYDQLLAELALLLGADGEEIDPDHRGFLNEFVGYFRYLLDLLYTALQRSGGVLHSAGSCRAVEGGGQVRLPAA